MQDYLVLIFGAVLVCAIVVLNAFSKDTRKRVGQLEERFHQPIGHYIHDSHHVVWLVGANLNHISCIDCSACSCHEPDMLPVECESLGESANG